MQWVAIIFPAFVSVVLSEMLEKKKYTGSEFAKYAGVYIFFTNFITVLIFQYVLRIPSSFASSFENNLYLIHYMMVNIFIAVVLPIVKLAVNPHLHIRVEKRSEADEEENEKE